MTPAQKKNAERFKKAAAEAKKIRAKNPRLTQAQAVKQAWAILYKTGKVSGAKKTATKNKAVKKSAAKSYHKDTKSHNVRISVVSGVEKRLSGIDKYYKIPEKEKTWFKKYVNSFYGKKGVFANEYKNNGYTVAELNKMLSIFFKLQHSPTKKSLDSWGGGDSVDRERFENMFLSHNRKK